MITTAHLMRAKVPKRYWCVKYSKIYKNNKKLLNGYFTNFLEWFKKGFGLYIYSEENSFGKTSIAVVMIKRALSFRKTALFIKPDQIQQFIIEHKMFDELTSYKERILEVDLLIIDDLNKEYCGETNYIKTTVEGIIRDRMQNLKPTIITTNIPSEKISEKYSKSMSEMFKECMFSIKVESDRNWREDIGKEEKKKYRKGTY